MNYSSFIKKSAVVFLTVFSLILSGCSKAEPNNKENQENQQNAETEVQEYGLFDFRAKDGIIEAPKMGLKITLPESFKKYGDSIALSGMVASDFSFARLEILDNGKEVGADILQILAYKNETDPKTLASDEIGTTEDMIKYIGTNSTLHYYEYNFNDVKNTNPTFFEERILSDLSESCQKIYLELLEYTDEVIDGIELTKLVLPESAADLIDSSKLMELTVKDLKGNPVRLGDYIENNKVTVLNFWGTFCGACVMEMPDLQDIEEQYKDQGVEIVGVVTDLLDEDDTFREDIMDKYTDIHDLTQVKYLNLALTQEARDFVKISCYPTTYIVDSQGHLLMEPVLGNRQKEDWIKLIEQCLEKAK